MKDDDRQYWQKMTNWGVIVMAVAGAISSSLLAAGLVKASILVGGIGSAGLAVAVLGSARRTDRLRKEIVARDQAERAIGPRGEAHLTTKWSPECDAAYKQVLDVMEPKPRENN